MAVVIENLKLQQRSAGTHDIRVQLGHRVVLQSEAPCSASLHH